MPDTVRRVAYYTATVPHRAGEGARVVSALSDAGVNFRAFHAFPEGGRAQFDFFPEDPGAFEEAAAAAGIEVSDRKTAFLVRGEDRVGAVAELLGKLANAQVNVVAMDAVSAGDAYGALVWVEPGAVDKAARALDART